jgi:hypothetical protein
MVFKKADWQVMPTRTVSTDLGKMDNVFVAGLRYGIQGVQEGL